MFNEVELTCIQDFETLLYLFPYHFSRDEYDKKSGFFFYVEGLV